MADTGPTRTALAAKALMERIDNPAHLSVLENRAVLGGWVGSRQAGCYDGQLSDSVAKAALGAVLDLLRLWASECDEVQDGTPVGGSKT